jgi:hypothetical protein
VVSSFLDFNFLFLFFTARPPFGQKIVPIFWPGQAPTLGYFNYGPEKLKFFQENLVFLILNLLFGF